MFYSQFILAKKGPLGTIWIAAHLERKLRKNQVADTDIGVSVDSILFPDVPIALRLSSHLLLGVVRIYSRKVNYLFDDCSEALLKIKQAFRSTAVDLPPEESTAPYHSITLPETFDLDDFELPDNDIFQGNYVDHHISTREQITLQDTMEGVVYSTSQFGLDERFGDGDASHAGLDLEEELLDKAAVIGHDEVSENDAQASVGPMPHPETYASLEKMAGSSEYMPLNGTTNKIPDLDEAFDVVDYADAPCTPGLVEPNVSSVKEGLACDDLLEPEEHSSRELMGKADNIACEPNLNHREDAIELSLGEKVNHDTLVSLPSEDNHLSGELEISQAAPVVEFLSREVTTHFTEDESVCSPVELAKLEDKGNEQTMSSMDRVNVDCEVLGVRSQEIGNDDEVPYSNGNATIIIFQSLELSSGQEHVNVESQECQGLVNREISNDHDNNNNNNNNNNNDNNNNDNNNNNNNKKQALSASLGFLRPCDSHTSQLNGSSSANNSLVAPELESVDVESLSLNTDQIDDGHVMENSTKLQGEECHVSDGIQSEKIRISEQTLNGKPLEDGGKRDKELEDVISIDNHCEDMSTSMTSELPAPEKLLSAPQRLLDEPHEMLTETPEKEFQDEGGGTGSKYTGKKRSFTESALTMQSLSSVDSLGVAKSKGTVESIPDDDDLLSSILVGRKSSVMKIKPSPPATEPPSKRARSSASRPSALKRKVLMDESMVLHGDTIRQQLTSTEDIRRLRKKAPCTHIEILMIQRQFLEVEIFNEPVLTGMSVELTHLHNEAFDLSRVRVCENDDSIPASLELVCVENSAKNIVNGGGEMEGPMDLVTSANDADGQLSEFPVQNGIQQDEDRLASHAMSFLGVRNSIAENMDFNCSVQDNLGELVEMEGCRDNFDVAVAPNRSTVGVATLQSELVSGEISEMQTGTIDQSALAADFTQMDTPNLLADKIGIQLNEEGPFVNDTSNVVGLEGIESVENRVSDRAELRTEEEAPLEETKISALDEIDASAPNDDSGASLANVSSLNVGCSTLSVNVGQDFEDVENDKNRVCNDDVGLAVSSGYTDQNPNPLCDDESKMDPICSIGFESDVKNTSINHGNHVTGQEYGFHNVADMQDSLDKVTPGDYDDIQGVPFANDTEFLNVDDDEMGEDDDEGMPNTEDKRLLENTGWSSRTRAVARYLQTLFDKEAGNGRKGLSIDNLLAGKTRKEASRMFFETLVLKTRDYVQVEQPRPFDNIYIKPRSKLMKSDF